MEILSNKVFWEGYMIYLNSLPTTQDIKLQVKTFINTQ